MVEFTLKIHNNGRLLIAEIPELTIITYPEDQDNLFSSIYVELQMLWRKYALVADSELSPSGLEIKRKLQEIFADS